MDRDILRCIIKKCMKEIDLLEASNLPILNLIGSLENMIKASYLFYVPDIHKDENFIGVIGNNFCIFKQYEINTINKFQVDFGFIKTITFDSDCNIIFHFSVCEPCRSPGNEINLESFMRFDLNLNEVIHAKTDSEKELKKFLTKICLSFFTPIETHDCFKRNIQSVMAHASKECITYYNLKKDTSTSKLYTNFELRKVL